jgi:hypothetical protein
MHHKLTVSTVGNAVSRNLIWIAAIAVSLAALAGCATMAPSAMPATAATSSKTQRPNLPVIHGSDDGGWGGFDG